MIIWVLPDAYPPAAKTILLLYPFSPVAITKLPEDLTVASPVATPVEIVAPLANEKVSSVFAVIVWGPLRAASTASTTTRSPTWNP
jgi:hypothetical protein